MGEQPSATGRANAGGPVIDPSRFRQVLGQYPTGVCVITARSFADEVIAMVVGSFSSVSLDPPLVAFFPDRRSSSWAKLRPCERFCVNILSVEQEDVCRKLASKDPDKFAGVAHRSSALGLPILDGAVAWIDCQRHAVLDAGDHELVMGRVLDLDVAGGDLPLLFFRGGYGRFAPASLVADQDEGITLSQLRMVDCARLAMERLTERIGGVCLATVRVRDELAVAASAGQPGDNALATLVGKRLPFAPPTGSIFAAWLPANERARWLKRLNGDSAMTEAALAAVRQRGYSVGMRTEAQTALLKRLHAAATDHQLQPEIQDLLSVLRYDPIELTAERSRDIRVITAPVFDAAGAVVVALSLYGFPNPERVGGIGRLIDEVVSTAATATVKLAGRAPATA